MAPGAFPWHATTKPFTLKKTKQFRADPPPALKSARYLRNYDEVKSLGSLLGSSRTPEQTDLSYFYAADPIGLSNRALRAIAEEHLHDISDTARVFALANLAVADAVITAWDSKYHYVFWRPITAIREGDNDGNPDTVGDLVWEPLINTPNYPDYTSGANNVTGAFMETLRRFFGRDRFTFTATTVYPLAIQKERTYTRFSDAARDVVDVRVLQGIHFRFADRTAREQGEKVAKWVFTRFLRPIEE